MTTKHRDLNGNLSSLSGEKFYITTEDQVSGDYATTVTNGDKAEGMEDANDIVQKYTSSKRGMKRHLSKHEVPSLFHLPHVEFGFRPMNQPWSYYLRSIFSMHNESLNVWTHLIPLILIIRKTLMISEELDFQTDSHTWPLLIGLLSGAFVLFCSTVAHWYHSKSEFLHYVFFMIDYFGIAQYALATGILHLSYSTQEGLYNFVLPYFFPLAVSLTVTICFCSVFTNFKRSQLNPIAQVILKMVPITVTYIIFNVPIIHRIFNCYIYGLECTSSIPYHLQQVISFAISGFFFGFDIPQKWFPGKHDYFMHSHHLFHVAIAVCILTEMDAAFIDFKINEMIVRSRPTSSFISTFLPPVLAFSINLVCVIYFGIQIHQRIYCNKMNNKQK